MWFVADAPFLGRRLRRVLRLGGLRLANLGRVLGENPAALVLLVREEPGGRGLNLSRWCLGLLVVLRVEQAVAYFSTTLVLSVRENTTATNETGWHLVLICVPLGRYAHRCLI